LADKLSKEAALLRVRRKGVSKDESPSTSPGISPAGLFGNWG
jgi:hypothetical protein